MTNVNTEHWQWLHDFTTKVDEFRSEEDKEKKKDERIEKYTAAIISGAEWMREEERIGRRIGFALALFFFFLLFSISYMLRHRCPEGYYEVQVGRDEVMYVPIEDTNLPVLREKTE